MLVDLRLWVDSEDSIYRCIMSRPLVGLLLAAVLALVTIATTTVDVSDEDALRNAIEQGASDISVMGMIQIGLTCIAITNATGLKIRGGAAQPRRLGQAVLAAPRRWRHCCCCCCWLAALRRRLKSGRCS